MKVSLILATLGRYEEVKIFLDSLLNQTYKDFEVIIVDQNEDGSLDKLVQEYRKNLDINHIKSNIRGISINRNKGLIFAKGHIVAFPDDDCEYEKNTIERAVNYLYDKPNSIYSCKTLQKGENYGTGIMSDKDEEIIIANVHKTIKSITFFVNFGNDDIPLFDSLLGVGAKFGSGEETDYVLNLLHKGYTGHYFSKHIVYHPAKKGNYDDLDRAYKYALGFGALCKKEIVKRKEYGYYLIFLNKVFRSIMGIIVTKNRKYHYTVLKGRLRGFIDYD